jgi:hypothetical protein
MTVTGDLEEDLDIYNYPRVEGALASLYDTAYCIECGHSGILQEFKNP